MHPPPYTSPRHVRTTLIGACIAVLALVVLISIALLLGSLLAAAAVLIGAVR